MLFIIEKVMSFYQNSVGFRVILMGYCPVFVIAIQVNGCWRQKLRDLKNDFTCWYQEKRPGFLNLGEGAGGGGGGGGCCGDEIDTEKPDPENLRHFDTPIKLRLLIPKKYAKVFNYNCAVIAKLMLD